MTVRTRRGLIWALGMLIPLPIFWCVAYTATSLLYLCLGWEVTVGHHLFVTTAGSVAAALIMDAKPRKEKP